MKYLFTMVVLVSATVSLVAHADSDSANLGELKTYRCLYKTERSGKVYQAVSSVRRIQAASALSALEFYVNGTTWHEAIDAECQLLEQRS